MEDKTMLPSIISNSNQGFFPSVLNDFFNDNWLMPQYHRTSPAINVTEDEKEFRVEVAAPGMTKDDFKLSLSDNDIVISMEKKTDTNDEKKDKKYIRREFSYTKFEQRLLLPENVDKEAIAAQMNDGVLVINIPKKTEEQKAQECKCIEIK